MENIIYHDFGKGRRDVLRKFYREFHELAVVEESSQKQAEEDPLQFYLMFRDRHLAVYHQLIRAQSACELIWDLVHRVRTGEAEAMEIIDRVWEAVNDDEVFPLPMPELLI